MDGTLAEVLTSVFGFSLDDGDVIVGRVHVFTIAVILTF